MTNTPDKSEMKALERVERRLNNTRAKHGFMTLTVSDLREVVSLARASSRPPADQAPDMVEVVKAARSHLHAMQHQARQYLEPKGYTSFDRKQIALEYDQEAKDSLFTSDMIYLLDGPEQRELEAKIDAALKASGETE